MPRNRGRERVDGRRDRRRPAAPPAPAAGPRATSVSTFAAAGAPAGGDHVAALRPAYCRTNSSPRPRLAPVTSTVSSHRLPVQLGGARRSAGRFPAGAPVPPRTARGPPWPASDDQHAFGKLLALGHQRAGPPTMERAPMPAVVQDDGAMPIKAPSPTRRRAAHHVPDRDPFAEHQGRTGSECSTELSWMLSPADAQALDVAASTAPNQTLDCGGEAHVADHGGVRPTRRPRPTCGTRSPRAWITWPCPGRRPRRPPSSRPPVAE